MVIGHTDAEGCVLWAMNWNKIYDGYYGLIASYLTYEAKSGRNQCIPRCCILWPCNIKIHTILERTGLGYVYFCLRILSTLQRQNTEISKQKYSQKRNIWVSVPSSTFMRLWAIYTYTYIPTIGLPNLLEEICRPILGLYKSLTDT